MPPPHSFVEIDAETIHLFYLQIYPTLHTHSRIHANNQPSWEKRRYSRDLDFAAFSTYDTKMISIHNCEGQALCEHTDRCLVVKA